MGVIEGGIQVVQEGRSEMAWAPRLGSEQAVPYKKAKQNGKVPY